MSTSENVQFPELPEKKLEEKDLLDLWKYFQDRADMLKERQWTVGTWVLTLASGLLAFSLSNEALSIFRAGTATGNPMLVIATGVVGILLCIYGWVVVYNYGKHIHRNWKRANRVKEKIIPLGYIVKRKFDKKPKNAQESDDDPQKLPSLPRESWYLIVIFIGFFLLFVGMILAGFFSMIIWFCNVILN